MTRTQQTILDALITYKMAKGFSPTIRELCALTGLKSTASVQYQLAKMREIGVISGEGRTLCVAGEAAEGKIYQESLPCACTGLLDAAEAYLLSTWDSEQKSAKGQRLLKAIREGRK